MVAALGKITKHNGVAGNFSYSVPVTYEGEPAETITFHGSVYGAPIVMETMHGTQTFVTDPGRFGEFSPEWVRRFFADT